MAAVGTLVRRSQGREPFLLKCHGISTSWRTLDSRVRDLSQPQLGATHELAAHSYSTSAARQADPAGGQDLAAGVRYSSHTPTATWQKAAIALGSALGALANPARADLVAALGETTGVGAYQRVLSGMRVDPEGRAVLAEQPRVTSAAVEHAWDLPPNTFGAAYARFMGSRNFSADERPPVRFVDDPDLAYVAARTREVHDFWHVLFGCPTTVSGELALKMVELTQTGLPMCALSVLGGPVRLSPEKRQRLRTVLYPWAVQAGLRATDLMCLFYEKHLEEDLEAVRRRWRIVPAPSVVQKAENKES